MGFAVSYARTQWGMQAPRVHVEAHISSGLPRLSIVGLAETAVKESKDRVQSAIINSGFIFPNRKITINLAPADLPKEGSRYDLAIAIGILVAADYLPKSTLQDKEFAGELALSGELRSVSQIVPWVIACRHEQQILILPHDNLQQAEVVKDASLLPCRSLLQVVELLRDDQTLPIVSTQGYQGTQQALDFVDVMGQEQAKRAMTIAAAGEHSMLMVGPPGSGKTMLASRFNSILPDPTQQEIADIATIASFSSQSSHINWGQRPFCAPHHTSTAMALVGGGRKATPGAVSRSHAGVLFLEFK